MQADRSLRAERLLLQISFLVQLHNVLQRVLDSMRDEVASSASIILQHNKLGVAVHEVAVEGVRVRDSAPSLADGFHELLALLPGVLAVTRALLQSESAHLAIVMYLPLRLSCTEPPLLQ